MKTLFVTFFILFLTIGQAQEDSLKRITHDSAIDLRPADADNLNTQDKYDSMQRARDMDNMNNNMRSLVELQDSRRSKEKRAAMLRIGFGVAMLAILVIGLRRRSRKKNAGPQ